MEKTYAHHGQESVFTGTMFGLLGINLASILITGITFGIAYPWVLCWKESWYKEHTYINGRQLQFNGTGMQLIGNWVKWLLLCFVTFGIYSLWLPIRIEQWTVKHTCFSGEAGYLPAPETASPLAEWITSAAQTVTLQAQRLWKKLCGWLRGIRSAHSWECSCGRRNSTKNRFCTACGQPQWREPQPRELQPRELRCPNCGARLSPNANFCGICAHRVHKR